MTNDPPSKKHADVLPEEIAKHRAGLSDAQAGRVVEDADLAREISRFFGEASASRKVIPSIAMNHDHFSVAAILERMDADKRRAFRALATQGWYPNPRWWDGTETTLARLLQSSPSDAELVLCDSIDATLDEILVRLAGERPQRERFLRAAFEAHRQGSFATSIPVLLAQADGICREVTGVQLQARNRKDGTPRLVEKFGDPESPFNVYLQPILEVFPINWNERERGSTQVTFLNRHAVLHGESLDYDTRGNSCKAISYLQYVSWVLVNRAEQTNPEDLE